MPSKATDLTILLKAVDKTKSAFGTLETRMGRIGKIAKTVGKAIAGIGAAAAAGFGKASAHGRELFEELGAMGRILGTTTQEADGLVLAIRQFVPGAGIERVRESLLTLEEGFFDAHAESGPLFDLMKDFGANIDFNVEGPRQQLVEFLKVLRQLPKESDRTGAAIANLGGDDAKALIPLIRNIESIDSLILTLSGNIENIPGIISEADQAELDRYTRSTNVLSDAWDRLGKEAFKLVDGPLASINETLAGITNRITDNIQRNTNAFSVFTKRVREYLGLQNEINPSGLLPAGQDDAISSFTGDTAPEIEEDPNRRIIDDLRRRLSQAEQDLASARIPPVPSIAPVLESPNGSLSDADFAELAASQRPTADLDLLDIENEQAQLFAFFSASTEAAQMMRDTTAEALAEIPFGVEAANTSFEDFGSTVNSVGSIINSFGSLAGRGADKAFKTFQQLQIAIGTAASISAALQVFGSIENPTFAQKIAAYGAALAKGLAAVAQIKQIRVGSGSTTAGANSIGGSAPSNQTVIGGNAPEIDRNNNQPRRNVTVNIQGNGLFTPEAIEGLIDAINDTDTGKRINANRVAA